MSLHSVSKYFRNWFHSLMILGFLATSFSPAALASNWGSCDAKCFLLGSGAGLALAVGSSIAGIVMIAVPDYNHVISPPCELAKPSNTSAELPSVHRISEGRVYGCKSETNDSIVVQKAKKEAIPDQSIKVSPCGDLYKRSKGGGGNGDHFCSLVGDNSISSSLEAMSEAINSGEGLIVNKEIRSSLYAWGWILAVGGGICTAGIFCAALNQIANSNPYTRL